MKHRFVLSLIPSVLLAGCAGMATGPTATVNLLPTAGNSVSGSVRFAQAGDAVRVVGDVRGLQPGSEVGFHVHEKGDCSSGDGMSAGGHFNPTGQPHGRYDGPTHHAGDLPSLRADEYGVAHISFETTALRVGSGANDVVGRALVVHRDADDFTTQPSGNSGPRVACGVIVRA
jgi:Cu-Zn family superoxide dismutase